MTQWTMPAAAAPCTAQLSPRGRHCTGCSSRAAPRCRAGGILRVNVQLTAVSSPSFPHCLQRKDFLVGVPPVAALQWPPCGGAAKVR